MTVAVSSLELATEAMTSATFSGEAIAILDYLGWLLLEWHLLELLDATRSLPGLAWR